MNRAIGLSFVLFVLAGILLAIAEPSAVPNIAAATTSSDFTITANPLNQTVPAGSSAKSQISLASINGFSGTINLTTSAPPLCISCPDWGINPSSINLLPGATANATLTFYSNLGTPPRSWTVTATGTSGSLSQSVSVFFTVVQFTRVPDFSLTANPMNLTIPAGTPGTSTVTIASLNGFNGTVGLYTSPSPLCPSPYCTTWAVNPSRVDLTPNSTAKAILTIYAGTGATGLSGNVTVYGNSGSLSHSVTVMFRISQPDSSGGVVIPVDRLALLIPYLATASIIVGAGLVGTSLTATLHKRRK